MRVNTLKLVPVSAIAPEVVSVPNYCRQQTEKRGCSLVNQCFFREVNQRDATADSRRISNGSLHDLYLYSCGHRSGQRCRVESFYLMIEPLRNR
jgi:hypothetical protein